MGVLFFTLVLTHKYQDAKNSLYQKKKKRFYLYYPAVILNDTFIVGLARPFQDSFSECFLFAAYDVNRLHKLIEL